MLRDPRARRPDRGGRSDQRDVREQRVPTPRPRDRAGRGRRSRQRDLAGGRVRVPGPDRAGRERDRGDVDPERDGRDAPVLHGRRSRGGWHARAAERLPRKLGAGGRERDDRRPGGRVAGPPHGRAEPDPLATERETALGTVVDGGRPRLAAAALAHSRHRGPPERGRNLETLGGSRARRVDGQAQGSEPCEDG